MYVQGRSGWVEKEVKDLSDRIGAAAASLVTQEDVLAPRQAARDALERAERLFEKEGYGYALVKPRVAVPKDPEALRALQQQVEEAFQAINQSLDALEKNIEKYRKDAKVTRAVPFVLAVLLFACGVAGFVWGLAYGSQIALFGSSGGVVFVLTLAFIQMHRYNREQLLLGTMVARLRTQVATCRGKQLEQVVDCMKHALGKVDEYFRELGAVAAELPRAKTMQL